MVLGTQRSNNEDERSLSAEVDAFGVKMARFEAIFGPVQKISHNFFKNQAFDIGLLPPKCKEYNVFRHEKM
jgi:hypothetical protein